MALRDFVCLGLTAALWACGSSKIEPPPPDLEQAPGWADALRLPELPDQDPDPAVFEADLTAKRVPIDYLGGKPTIAWSFEGSVPGPLIRVPRGARVIVRFHNQLEVPTTIHWHGVRLDNAMDGVPEHSQPEVPPGGSFTYDFSVPDAGLFWYHPHVASAAQVGFGLYGALLVEDPAEPAELGEELVIVLSDMAVNDDGQLQAPDSGGDLATLFGREGQLILVNGKIKPTLHVRPGTRLRLRVLNAAKSRYFQLALAAHSFLEIGSDGGLLSAPRSVERPVLGPAERADLLLNVARTPGANYPLRWVPFDRGYGSTEFRVEEIIAQISVEGEELVPPALPSISRSIAPLPTADAEPISLRLTQSATTGVLQLGINDVPSWRATPLLAKVGATQLFTIDNEMDWAHPFHLHGFFFQVLRPDGSPDLPIAWKDTVQVPVKGRVKLVVRYDDRPGMWMFHCHVLDHADAGMMGMIDLEAEHGH